MQVNGIHHYRLYRAVKKCNFLAAMFSWCRRPVQRMLIIKQTCKNFDDIFIVRNFLSMSFYYPVHVVRGNKKEILAIKLMVDFWPVWKPCFMLLLTRLLIILFNVMYCYKSRNENKSRNLKLIHLQNICYTFFVHFKINYLLTLIEQYERKSFNVYTKPKKPQISNCS